MPKVASHNIANNIVLVSIKISWKTGFFRLITYLLFVASPMKYMMLKIVNAFRKSNL